MLCRKLRCTRRQLTWLLTVNLSLLALLFLVAYDSNLLLGWGRTNKYHAAYRRWKDIRGNWVQYHGERARQAGEEAKRVGLQLDQVVGFDVIHAAAPDPGDSVRDIRYKVQGPLDFIPPVPRTSDSDIVPSLTDRITRQYLALPNVTYSQKIVILTPICDIQEALERYVKLLAGLTYPHKLISVYFGEDSSGDRTFDLATLLAAELKEKYGFHDAAAYHFNISGGVHGSWGDIHYRTSQLKRRSHLAKARNLLLNVGLHGGDFDHVLWVDGDVTELPRDLVQQLLVADSDVAAATCLYRSDGYRRIFDKNSWRETPTSLQDQAGLGRDVLLVEGYTNTYRIYLSDLRAEGRVVPLDGVGGCALMVKTACHRAGLNFPETVYRNHIETEGLAKMAADMGFSVRGLPFVEVFH